MKTHRIINAGIVQGLGQRLDGSVKFTIVTQEAPPALVGEIAAFNNKYIKFLITDGEVHEQEADLLQALPLDAPKSKKFSKSQILRFALNDLYKRAPNGYTDFELFYEAHMDMLIEHVNKKSL